MKILKLVRSGDETTYKATILTEDNYVFEITYVSYYNKHIICYSTQIGCTNGCTFCYSGIHPNFIRNLTVPEIVVPVSWILDRIREVDKPVLISAMGVGEPLNNYDNYISSLHEMHQLDPQYRFALATSGCDPKKIVQLANDVDKHIHLKLMVSLHSATSTRAKMMPASAPIDDIIESANKFNLISGNPVEYNIVLIDSLNDSKQEATEIYKLFKRHGMADSAHIKINSFNNIIGSTMNKSVRADAYVQQLKKYGLQVELYETNGTDVNAACGQMRAGSSDSIE